VQGAALGAGFGVLGSVLGAGFWLPELRTLNGTPNPEPRTQRSTLHTAPCALNPDALARR